MKTTGQDRFGNTEEIPEEIAKRTRALFDEAPPTNPRVLIPVMEFWAGSDIEGAQSLYLWELDWVRYVEKDHFESVDYREDFRIYREAKDAFGRIFE